MHRLNFCPLGNADSCRIDLENGKKLLVDYANTRSEDNPERVALDEELKSDLRANDRWSYEVVAFTHLDKDHICGSSEFFWFEHAAKYQDEARVKIDELWVPAAAITEKSIEDDEAKILRQEARHRLREGAGIRVFSRPERLREWLEGEGLTLEDRAHLITDAGQLVPGFSVERDGVEFFVHSPFAVRQDENTVEDRNTDALAFQGRFVVDQRDTRVLMLTDLPYEALEDMVQVTRHKGNEDRLEWDVVGLPHHCSYLSLGPEKGEEITEPVEDVRWLYEEQGRPAGRVISTSEPIPSGDTDQPPHRQAAKFYEKACNRLGGEFLVTMEYPDKDEPSVLVIKIGGSGASVEKLIGGAASVITSKPAPRAG